MKKQDKELLIKDLCARLPYGVKGIDTWYDKPGNFHTITGFSYIPLFGNTINFDNGNNSYLDHNSFKPILFPLSAINQEIEVNGEKITIGCTWKDTSLPELETRFRIDKEGNLFYDVCGALVPLNDYTHAIDTFHRYHIDYRGLIDKGLAISVFDLPENPYK